MKKRRPGEPLIQMQGVTGFESASELRDAFSKIRGADSVKSKEQHLFLKATWLDSPLGPMLAIADEEKLFLLEFIQRRGLDLELERLRNKIGAAILPGITPPLHSIDQELQAYFKGTLKEFKTPFMILGSDFQKRVWKGLLKIPYGTTMSYAAEAALIKEPKATRAVANANGANQLAIIIPCHRIIRSNGDLGGYGGGIAKKEWLLKHEAKYESESFQLLS